MWSHRDLVVTLARRQYQLKYRQSLAGLFWVVLPLVATLGAGTLVFHKVADVDTEGVSYTMFVISALVPWTFFATSLTFGIPSIVQSQIMVSRLAFPRMALPLGMIGTSFIDLLLSVIIFVAMAYTIGDGLPATAAWFPVLMSIEIVLIVGLVLWGSALNVFARDIKLAVPVVVQLWLLVTPVMYPLGEAPEHLRRWFLVNPMAGLVESFRAILVMGEPPDVRVLLPAIVGAVTTFVIGCWYFSNTESRFADAI